MVTFKSIPSFLLLTLLLTFQAPVSGQQTDTAPASVVGQTPAISPETSTRLDELDKAIATERQRLDSLTIQLGKASDPDEKSTLERQIKEVKERLQRLRQSIEQIVIGNIDTTPLTDQAPEKIDWRAELEMISLPVLASLRDLTAKPRRIESLRGEIAESEEKLEIIESALASAQAFEKTALAGSVKERISAITGEWRSRKTEVGQRLETARLQLASLSGQTKSVWVNLREGLTEFVQGRGLTLMLALAVGVVTWLILRGLLTVYERVLAPKGRTRTTRLRVVEYAYRAISFLLITISVVAVFYIRNDLLLMALSIAAIIGLALGLRQIIPRYIRETRLLLDIGPVREGERVVVGGVPFKVVSLNVNSILKNPRLDGVLRLPLSALEGMTSRPEREEPWFPTKNGDYVLLNDGKLAQIVSQSVEFVQLKVAESRIIYSSADFLGQGVRNLSVNGYGLALNFGIDYNHQAIAVDEPPEAFRNEIAAVIERMDLASHVQDIAVEFKEAASNSLDYLILLTVKASGASLYFKLSRLVQQACVRVCNERDWVIPFNQLTLHPGNEFDKFEISRRATTTNVD